MARTISFAATVAFVLATAILYLSAYYDLSSSERLSRELPWWTWFATTTTVFVAPRILISLLCISRGGTLFVAGAYTGFAVSFAFTNWLGSGSSDKLGVMLFLTIGLFTGMAGAAAGIAIRQHQNKPLAIFLSGFLPVLVGALLPIGLAVRPKF